jgi:hypothetical protein
VSTKQQFDAISAGNGLKPEHSLPVLFNFALESPTESERIKTD